MEHTKVNSFKLKLLIPSLIKCVLFRGYSIRVGQNVLYAARELGKLVQQYSEGVLCGRSNPCKMRVLMKINSLVFFCDVRLILLSWQSKIS